MGTIHNISQDRFGVTTNLMSLIKSYILCKNLKYELCIYNDSVRKLNVISDIPIKIEDDFFKGMSLELFREIKKKPLDGIFGELILDIAKNQRNLNPVRLFTCADDIPTAIEGDILFYHEWFPKIHPVKIDCDFNLKVKIKKPECIFDKNITVFHVKNKSLLNVKVDIEITDYMISRYVSDNNISTDSLRFVSGCFEMVKFFSEKYGVNSDSHYRYRPLYHREKGDELSVLTDILNCSLSNFITNDELHMKYYSEISDKYKDIPSELCFYNSIKYKKHIFDESFYMSNYFDLFVKLNNRLNFINYDSQF